MASSNSDTECETVLYDFPVKHGATSFTYCGLSKCLKFKGHAYDYDVGEYLEQEPLRTKSGNIASRQPPPPQKMPATYWKAQCIFRGLNPGGTMTQLQVKLKGHERDGMTQELSELQKHAGKEFKIKNKEAAKELLLKEEEEWEEKWIAGKLTALQKLNSDPRRHLLESLPKPDGEKKNDAVCFTHEYRIVQYHANELGLHSQIMDAPPKHIEDLEPDGWTGKWIIIGRDLDRVTATVHLLNNHSKKRKREIKEAVEEEKRRKKRATEQALAGCKSWDVTGKWKISCPYIEQEWDTEELTLNIFNEKTSKGTQLFAKFDFGVVTGVFRFERQEGEERSKYDAKGSAKNKNSHDNGLAKNEYEDEEEYDSDSNSDSDRRSPTPEAFYLGKTCKVSATKKKWNYRWRGEETGEGETQLDSDSNLYTVTFGGRRGFQLEGTFGGGCCEECTFTGEKISGEVSEDIDIAEEWAEHSHSSYCYYADAPW